ncbi:MAG: hypothetical protein AAFN10_25785 [Bacteroidota bacterium]
MEFIATLFAELIFGVVFHTIGAAIRWAFFMGKKSWKEIFDNPQNYNAIVGLIFFLMLICVLIAIFAEPPA